MFPELNNILDIGVERPPLGQVVLVSNTGADSSFILHHLVALYLKGGYNVCFVAFAQSYNHYNNVGNKLSVTYNTARENGNLVFVEGLKAIGEAILNYFDTGSEGGGEIPDINAFDIFEDKTLACLHPLYEHVRNSIDRLPNWKTSPTLVVIDDLSILLAMGVNFKEVIQFCHHLQHLVCPSRHGSGCLAIFLPQNQSAEDEESAILQTYLHHQSTLMVQVEGLRSGYSKDVHGEISIQWRYPAQNRPQQLDTKRMQFKVTDKNVIFFALGMSAAVL